MIIDQTHKRWAMWSGAAVAAALVIYVPYAFGSKLGARGGSALGLAYGVASAMLMVAAGLLGVRRKTPGWRIGRMQTWMRAHLWLGLVALPLALCHGGFSMGGGPLSRTLMVLLLLVSASGIAGAALQHFLPRVITMQVPMETIYEQIAHVREQLREEAEQLVLAEENAARLPAKKAVAAGAEDERTAALVLDTSLFPLREFLHHQVRPLLAEAGGGSMLADHGHAERAFQQLRRLLPTYSHETVSSLEQVCEEGRQLHRQVLYHRMLHGWLLVHVPMSYALLALTVVHAVQSLRY